MYCKHCGKPIADDSSFCQYCGSKVDSCLIQKNDNTSINENNIKPSINKGNTIKKNANYQQQHLKTLKRVGKWILVCVCVSLLGFWDSKKIYWSDLLQFIILGSLVITIGTNWEEIKSLLGIKNSNENKLSEKFDDIKIPGRKYCAFTGNVINGEYVLVKHKHIVDESTKISRFGMFGQHTKSTTTTTYYWEAFYVDAKAYYNYKHSFGYWCYIIIPFISFLLPVLFFVATGIGYHNTETIFQFTIFGAFISLIPFQITRFFLRIFVEPNLKKIGLVDSMDVIDSYISTKHPKAWNVIRYLQGRERNFSDDNNFRFSKLPEFKSQII